MKKSSFVTLILGSVSLIFFALGFCMALLPEWNLFGPGVLCGCVGLGLGLVTWLVRRRLTGQPPLRFSPRLAGLFLLGLGGTVLFGGGLCLCMVWNRYPQGIAVSLAGLAVYLILVPLSRGIREG